MSKKSSFISDDGFSVPARCTYPDQPYCVSIKITDDAVMVRDTKDPHKTTLTFNHNEWKAFTAAIRKGQFDI